MKNKKRWLFLLSPMLVLFSLNLVFAQVREYLIHDRGMLWETVYNNGMIARPLDPRGNEDGTVAMPQMEWPARSETIIEGKKYYGQHLSKGAGMWIIANPDGKPGITNRLWAFCGGVGGGEQVVGTWAFPLAFIKENNYPILDDGSLNPAYDPGEAEQIITAKWATSTGVTVTRVSRQWSYPDYDDMIIYEYTLEYTGSTDGDPSDIEMEDETLTDVMVAFNHTFAPSLFGYMRNYQQWKWKPGVHQSDNWACFDSDYWLIFQMDGNTGKADIPTGYLAGKPEPDADNFKEWSETGKHGGGLLSPQAPGLCILYYDTEQLAVIDTADANRNESEYVAWLKSADELDENGHIRQPWEQQRTAGWNTSHQMVEGTWLCPRIDQSRSGPTYDPHPTDEWWNGRKTFTFNAGNKAVSRVISFGPYKLSKGDKIEFSMAEVCGYGAEPGKMTEGATQTKEQFAPTPTWDKEVILTLGGKVTDHYLTDYGYPDYVNSEVRNVTQVAHKAFEAYTGQTLAYSDESGKNPMRPEENLKDGDYSKIPVPPPSPVIVVKNTATGEVKITWTRAAETFTHPHLTASLSEFRVYRSYDGMGPWKQLETVGVGNVSADQYEYLDTDPEFVLGSKAFYAVTSVDANGVESGKPNIVEHLKSVGAAEKLGKIYAVPNPYHIESGFPGSGEEDMIRFYGLTEECTIRIYSFAGQLVETIEHKDPSYSEGWMQITRNQQAVTPGVYFYVVTTVTGEQERGKLVIIK